MESTGAQRDIVSGVVDRWKAAVDAHDPQQVASCFTEDAIFQGLLSSVIYRLEEMQRILKHMLGYLDQLGDVDAYNSSVTDYNNLIEDLNTSRDDYARLCAGR